MTLRNSTLIGGLAVTAALASGCSLPRVVPAPAPTTASPAAPAAGTGSASPSPSADSSRGDHGVYNPPPIDAPAAAQQVVDAFAKAWARPDLPANQWWAGVSRYTTGEYAEKLKTVDPANVPASAVVGPATSVSANAETTVWAVPTDVGTVQVTCTRRADKWLVSLVEWHRQ